MVVCVGRRPAGLFFAINLKRIDPNAEVAVYERNQPDDTFGWGVVFSDQTLGNIAAADPQTYAAIERSFVHWDDIEIFYRDAVLRAGGQGFAGMSRKRLLAILQERARELGVDLRFQTEISDDAAFANADAIVVADGANTSIRR